jgi:hypothetical protein
MRSALTNVAAAHAGVAVPPAAPAVYRFDNSLADAAAGGKDLAGGSPSYASGMFGQALSAGTPSRAQDLLTGPLDSAAYSVSCWLYAPSGGTPDAAVQFLTAGGLELFAVASNVRNAAAQSARLRFNDGATITSNNNAFARDAWAHVAASVSGGLAQLWIDGVQRVANQAAPAGLTFDAGGMLRVSIADAVMIDDLGIKQAALTQADVDALYAGGVGSLYPTS